MRTISPFILGISSLCLLSTIHARTIRVPGEVATIQAGIDAAVNGDTVMVADGTYTGLGNRDIEFDGKAIVVVSENGPENCIIDSQGDPLNFHRAFAFRDSEDSTSVLSGFTITGGYISRGGGILCYPASPLIVDNIIKGNISRQPGAGVSCYYYSHPILRDNIIEDNEVVEEGSFFLAGGGIACELLSNPVITNNLIRGNRAGFMGGGIYLYESDPLIANNVIVENTSRYHGFGYGGGICGERFSDPLIINNTIYSNVADSGGGLALYGDDPMHPEISNTILWGNTPDQVHVGEGSPNPPIRYCNVQGGWPGLGNIETDPLFVDPDNGDFHLSDDSPCIDSGADVEVFIDFENDSRPVGYGFDIGVDETPHSVPYNLTIAPTGPVEVRIGESLSFRSLIQNNTNGPVSGDFWLVARLPNSMEIQVPEDLLNIPNPQSGELFPNSLYDPFALLFVPAIADTGTYTLIGRIGDHPGTIIDASSFRFRVIE